MPEEKFRVRADEWQTILKQEFPHAQAITEWVLAVTEKDGMPVLDPDRQTMTLRHTFWRMTGQKKDHGMQIWPDKISFNLLGGVGNPRDFSELEQLRQKWLPRWVSHFEISKCNGVTLEYINLLSKDTLPAFMNGNILNVGNALRLFDNIPSRLGPLIPPFDFQINSETETNPRSRFRVHCVSVPSPSTPVMHLRFNASTYNPKRSVPIDDVANETAAMHDLILQQFDAYFTEKAKQSFEPK